MAAVGALAGVGVARGARQRAGIVLFLLGGIFIRDRRQHMLRRIIPGQHTGHGGPGQGIVNALHRGQRHSER